MENVIKKKKKIAKDTYMLDVQCKLIAKKAKPGQFIMIRLSENGERIPLTIADHDDKNLTIVFKIVGYSTKALANLRSGSTLYNIIGPLGTPSLLEGSGNICFIGGGVGVAAMYPLIKALNKKGNNIITIIGARSKEHLFWLNRIRKMSNKVLIATEDGSMGKKGRVTDILRVMMRRRLEMVYSVGPLMMMKNVSKYTWRMVKTKVSLNPLMVDGIGMCGGCRVTVGDKVKFCCVDGPEFDAHNLDWDEVIRRNTRYVDEEKNALKRCKSCSK